MERPLHLFPCEGSYTSVVLISEKKWHRKVQQVSKLYSNLCHVITVHNSVVSQPMHKPFNGIFSWRVQWFLDNCPIFTCLNIYTSNIQRKTCKLCSENWDLILCRFLHWAVWLQYSLGIKNILYLLLNAWCPAVMNISVSQTSARCLKVFRASVTTYWTCFKHRLGFQWQLQVLSGTRHRPKISSPLLEDEVCCVWSTTLELHS